jgi:DNA-binding CsgD family transcriptional regulator
MNFSRQDDSLLKSGFYEFIFWYRIAALILVLLYTFFQIETVGAQILIAVFAYNAFLRVFRKPIRRLVLNYPVIVIVDVAVSFALLSITGGYRSPFQLYSYCSVISGAYLLGYRAAFVLASIQSILYYIAVGLNGDSVANIVNNGDQLITTCMFYFAVGVSIAYISELVRILNVTTGKKQSLEQDLDKTLSSLQALPDFAELSKRELQMLCLILDGKTIEQAATVLSISKDSAKTYLSRIYKKTGFASRYEAISKAFEKGYMSD